MKARATSPSPSAGIALSGANTSENLIIGNTIGQGADGLPAGGNVIAGVLINTGASDNRVGGDESGEANLITGNAGIGVGLQIFLVVMVFLASLFSGYIVVWSLLNPGKIPPATEHFTFVQRLYESRHLIPVVGLIGAVLGSITGGVAPSGVAAARVRSTVRPLATNREMLRLPRAAAKSGRSTWR